MTDYNREEREAAWVEHLKTKRNSRQARKSSFDAGWDAALDLFEQAHTPTDDERAQAGLDSERLRQLAEWLSMEHGHEETAKRINLIANRHDRLALRRPAQGELLPDYFAPKPMPQGWVWAEPQEVDADPDTAFEPGRVDGAESARRTVQAEPTDAQVQAFVTAINAVGVVLDRRTVKAGLRAALKEGENR